MFALQLLLYFDHEEGRESTEAQEAPEQTLQFPNKKTIVTSIWKNNSRIQKNAARKKVSFIPTMKL